MFPTHGNNQINWASTDYKLPLATSFHGTPNVDTPLAEVFNGTVKSGYGKFFMPPSFDNNDEEKCRQTLFPLLHRIAGDCGFTVTCRFRKTAKVVRAILVGCSRSEKYQLPPENKKNPRNCYTARPLKSEHRCNFHFFLRYDPLINRWYINANDRHHCLEHRLHSRRQVLPKARNILANDLDLFRTLVNANLSPRTVAQVMLLKTGKQIDAKQVSNFRHQCHECFVTNEDGSKPNSSAQRVLNYVRNDPEISYVAVMGGSMHMMSPSLRMLHLKSGCNEIQVGLTPEDMSHYHEEAAEEVALMQRVTKTTKVTMLLGLAWVTDQSLRNFCMFPEVLSGDTTHKVNSSKMPLHTYVGKNSENQIFPVMHAFMSSEQQ